ncbi:hypothetical protein [Romboutsia lituseburensis]|uniref:Uncharacterized protein n=1 Tax=Romboutsia lituseburensis DSM 797 TaxID=1121325 RepID=A0A1G9M371_9FIRM|nr:hypothetical protein [Romboutsia lituseburensis]CEH34641.1 Hypothetical protein RLITU_2057 [Romboutsia lituseburensis]SDL68573.1 hypothetical protein SAMN04515677_10346 [Romboutsia lituseburensis DSM 797]
MNKKTLVTGILVMTVVLIGGYIFMKPTDVKKIKEDNHKVEEVIETKEANSTIEFLRKVHGLKVENVELIDNPVGFEGSFLAPKESIKNGIDHFLKESKNEKISKLNIDIGDGYIKAIVDYNITKNIVTPIEFKIKPSLNKNKDLVLNIDEVKFLDLKVSKWIVNIGINNFVKDWFSEESDIVVAFNDGNVIIDKSNFKSVTLNNISIDSAKLKLDMIINLERMI